MAVFKDLTRLVLRSLRLAAMVAAVAAAPLTQASAEGLTVFAAASLKDVLEKINKDWVSDGHPPAAISFAGSSALAKQIEQAAPADIFISADLNWMDYLAKAGLVAAETRLDLLGNTLVLVAPKDTTLSLTIARGFPLAETLGSERLAMANTDAVPAGVYGKAALTSLGVWDGVRDKVAQAENVRAALLLVSRGEAPLGIVYETDAKADPGVRIVGRFPKDSHAPIIYPAAVLKASRSPDARAFLDYLSTRKATAVFEAAGFSPLGAAR